MKKILLLSAFVGLFTNCNRQDNDLFADSPTERFENRSQELLQHLLENPEGWKLVYQTNEDKYGAYAYLMKFNENGEVTMVSDFNQNTATPETSLYEIKWGQGPMLSFVTKNHLHILADAALNERGKGYEGEFEFVYQGEENGMLKFKTQRKGHFVYMVKATSADWEQFTTFSEKVENFAKKSYQYYGRFSNNGSVKNYRIEMLSRRIRFFKNDTNESYKSSFSASTNSFLLFPNIVIDGNTFTEFVYNEQTQNYIAKAKNSSATFELIFTENPIDEHITNDFETFSANQFSPSLNGRTDKFKNFYLTSESFANAIKFDDKNDATLIVRFYPTSDNLITISVTHNFTRTSFSDLILSAKYEYRNNKIYLNNADFNNMTSTRNLSIWKQTRYKSIYDKALATLRLIYEKGQQGYYLEKRPERNTVNEVEASRVVYVLQNGDFYFPVFSE